MDNYAGKLSIFYLARQPLVVWSVVGAFFVGLQLIVFSTWLMSESFATVSTGEDLVPLQVRVAAWVTQANAVLFLLVCIFYCIRQSRREKRMAWDVLLVVGGLSVCWLDTTINFFEPVVFYNSYMINWGSWNSFIPGWPTGSGELAPEPIIFVVGLYGGLLVLFGVIYCCVLRGLIRRWPRLSRWKLVVCGFAVIAMLDFALEMLFVISGLYAYNIVIPGLTLWVGQPYQIPLYGCLLIAALCTPVAILRYQAQLNTYSSIEKLSPSYKISTGLRSVLRCLAMVGFINVLFILAVSVHWVLGFWGETTLTFPSYLSGG